MAATQRPASSDCEAELHTQSSKPLPVDSDLPSAVLKESSHAQVVTHTSDLRSTPAESPPDSTDLESHPDSADVESHPDSGNAESAAHHKAHWFSHWSHAKLQQLVSRLTAKHELVQPSLTEAPDTTSSCFKAPAESEHLSRAQADAEQPQDAESAQHDAWSRTKLQQLVSWLTAQHEFVEPSLTEAPETSSSSLEQPAESEHLSYAQADAMQPQDTESAQHADAESAQHANAESAQTDDAASSRSEEARQDSEQRAESRMPGTILSGTNFFLLTAASLLAAWLVSSLLLGWLPNPLRRPTTPEAAQTLLEEEEEWESPEAAGFENAEEEGPQTSEEETSLVIRARSVARGISEAVSGLVTNRSEEHEVEAGMEADSAPGVSGVSTSRRGRRPRGTRELAALGEYSSLLPLIFG